MQKRVETKDVVSFNAKAIAAFRDEVAAMTPQQRQDALRAAKRSFAESVVRLAVLVTVCDENGEQMPFEVSPEMRRFLGGVAMGRMHPDTALYLNAPNAMKLLSQLQPSEQQKVVKAGSVEVRKSPGTIASVPLRSVTATDIAKAVDSVTGSVKPAKAQEAHERAPRQPASSREVCCRIDYSDFQALGRLAAERSMSTEAVLKSLILREIES